MSETYGPFRRTGEPGGPGCPVGTLPITLRGPDSNPVQAYLFDAGDQATELEMLRTVAGKCGIQWGHDDSGWWAVVTPAGQE